jgi:hypothetical protein
MSHQHGACQEIHAAAAPPHRRRLRASNPGAGPAQACAGESGDAAAGLMADVFTVKSGPLSFNPKKPP